MDNKLKVGDRVRKLSSGRVGKIIEISVYPWARRELAFRVEFPYCTDWFLEDELTQAEEFTPIEKNYG
jgi:hypothetical protein